MRIEKLVVMLILAFVAGIAAGQSFNVEFGRAGTAPGAGYGGVGMAGVWNSFESMASFERLALVGLDGQPIAADIMNIGFDVIESADIAGTSGDDEALLDDCFTSFNDPVDGCLFMRFLEPGEYRVIMYGIAPDDVSLLSRLRIDQNTEEPVLVGGVWAGAHEEGVTYMSQIATVGSDGRLDIHSGLPGGNIRSVCNGIQVVRLAPACAADLTGDGELNFFDVSAFLNAFTAMDPVADFTGDGVLDFFDVSGFLHAYNAGCP
ncbi:MAG: GC-type dockerin domain-anchored protein [Phycisphaerales bacterium]